MKVKKTLESNIPRRFAQVNNMPEGEIYSFFFECYLAYMEMFRERMKFGRILNQIISEYKDIDEFKKSTPRRIYSELLRSEIMQDWFVVIFWHHLNKALMNKRTDPCDILYDLAYIKTIPSKKMMEDILNGSKNRYLEGAAKGQEGDFREKSRQPAQKDRARV